MPSCRLQGFLLGCVARTTPSNLVPVMPCVVNESGCCGCCGSDSSFNLSSLHIGHHLCILFASFLSLLGNKGRRDSQSAATCYCAPLQSKLQDVHRGLNEREQESDKRMLLLLPTERVRYVTGITSECYILCVIGCLLRKRIHLLACSRDVLFDLPA